MAKKVIIAYIPVIHQGYYQLLEKHPAYHSLYILGRSITQRYRPLQKEIRALDPYQVRQLLPTLNLLDDVKVVEQDDLAQIAKNDLDILMPDDEISHDLAEMYFSTRTITFSPIFLRWDRRNIQAKDPVDEAITISTGELDEMLMKRAYTKGLASTNIWRRVGALLAKDGEVIAEASNTHRPSEYTPWLDGDIRSHFGKGIGLEMSTDQHAESCVIGEAARRGIGLEGSDLYVTTFPCPPCAMLIAYSGIKRLFFSQGYAVLDGKRVLDEQGVRLIKVVAAPKDQPETYVPYPES